MAGFVRKCPCLRPQIDEDVHVLDYRHCSLTDVPGEVFNFERTLEELLADSNQIRDLPRELFYCHGLRKLSISDNEIKVIPPAIASLVSLEEFDFSKNGIINVPDNIKGCKYLSIIEASVNPLGKLPEGFTQLQNLTQLFLNDTFLDYLPGSFGRLCHLRYLELRENHLKTLPKSFGRLTELERLDIGNNEFNELPDVVGSLTSLLELWCDSNQITKVTNTIGNLKQLMFLDGSKNNIETLPAEIEGCTSLADLHLTTNNLQSLPDSLGNLNNLTTLKVDDNELTTLPKTLGGLSDLSEFNISANDLESLPTSIGLLRNLRTFYADENFLEFLPAELGSCNGITVLSLRSNKLSYIPDEIGRIPRLRVLNLSDNRLKYLPFSFIKLKELQALWLTENQTRPLIPLQSDYDQDIGRKFLTCYLLPQGPLQDGDDDGGGGDNDSFHPSIWDEERARRQQIQFEFEDEMDTDGQLVRCPTPYPKEMREKARHIRNLALRQSIPASGDVRWDQGAENLGYESEGNPNYPHGEGSPNVRMREARITKPSSPSLQETHRLYRYDKEKLMKDKARMQRRNSQEFEDDSAKLLTPKSSKKDGSRGDRKGDNPRKGGSRSDTEVFPRNGPHSGKRHGSIPNIAAQTAMNQSSSQHDIYGTDAVYYKQLSYHHNHPRGKHSRRLREYDSDTGYRSDPEVVKFRNQVLNDSRRGNLQSLPHPHQSSRRRGRDGGYVSDLEAYSHRTREAAYNSSALSKQHPAQSLPYDLHSQVQKSNSDSMSVPHSRRIMLKNDDLYAQPTSVGERSRNNLTLPSPSPSLFHRNRFVDQSTPVTLEPPESFPPPEESQSSSAGDEADVQNKDFRRELYTVLEERMQKQSGETAKPMPGSLPPPPPPPYTPAPAYRRTPERTNSASSGDRSCTDSPRNYQDSPMGQKQLKGERHAANTPNASNVHRDYETWTLDRTQPAVYEGSKHLRPHPEDRGTFREFSQEGTPLASRSKMPSDRLEHRESSRDQNQLRRERPTSQTFENLPHHCDSPRDMNQFRRERSNSRGFDHSEFRNSPLESEQYQRDRSNSRTFENNPGYRDSGQCPRERSNSRTHEASVDPYGSERSKTPVSFMEDTYSHSRNSPRGMDQFQRERSNSRTLQSNAESPSRYDPYPHPYGEPAESHNPVMTKYEDVEIFKSVEPPSQVSSSTDSGYGHGHNIYERVGDYSQRYSGRSGSQPPSSPASQHHPTIRRNSSTSRETHSRGQSREGTPIREEGVYSKIDVSSDGSYQETQELFRVNIAKNPGLGFSVAGGIGSPGNPYRQGDKGIFVTKIQPGGPAAVSLRPGDKIMEVNGIDFTNIEHNYAVSVMKTSKTVALLVERLQKINIV